MANRRGRGVCLSGGGVRECFAPLGLIISHPEFPTHITATLLLKKKAAAQQNIYRIKRYKKTAELQRSDINLMAEKVTCWQPLSILSDGKPARAGRISFRWWCSGMFRPDGAYYLSSGISYTYCRNAVA
ncbi:hypothetical protein D1614_15295 [Maribellus luteus]|uniref:Uncharacterized protein n=1 Tax=Maribellus luteus TaxID=2305463 RepID=A0A399SWR9_9BACT|nr:hypothetical protein D1614_15295 [Maribellus luteus]